MATARTRPIYRSPRWRAVRTFVLDRSGWRCEGCGRAGILEVHHRRPLAEGGEPFEPENLQVLCRPCHFEATGAAMRHPVRQRLREFLTA